MRTAEEASVPLPCSKVQKLQSCLEREP
jgi:hypothetical protein